MSGIQITVFKRLYTEQPDTHQRMIFPYTTRASDFYVESHPLRLSVSPCPPWRIINFLIERPSQSSFLSRLPSLKISASCSIRRPSLPVLGSAEDVRGISIEAVEESVERDRSGLSFVLGQYLSRVRPTLCSQQWLEKRGYSFSWFHRRSSNHGRGRWSLTETGRDTVGYSTVGTHQL